MLKPTLVTRPSSLLLALILATSAGCASFRQWWDDQFGEAKPVVLEARGCPPSRWVATVENGACPVPPPDANGDWATRWLFDLRTDPIVRGFDLRMASVDEQRLPALPEQNRARGVRTTGTSKAMVVRSRAELLKPPPRPDLPRDLLRYCVYEWLPRADNLRAQPQAAPKVAGASQVASDCQVVGGTAPPTPEPPEPSLEKQLLEAINFKPPADAATPGALPRVRIAVVDTEPDGAFTAAPGPHPGHGRAVGAVINRLACPTGGPTCAVSIFNHQAMGLLAPDLADTSGRGHFGSHADVAAAIERALAGWRALWHGRGLAASETPRLIVNLSLGWDSGLAAGKSGRLPNGRVGVQTGVQAVRTAILRARCQGAVVIAAAGNGVLGHPNEGPLLPGGWEDERFSPGDCGAVGGTDLPPRAEGYPLLFAVGGIDRFDYPLPSTRRKGRPRLAAYGHSVALDSEPEMLARPRSGTSMAAAVTSGIAAAAWNQAPALSGGDKLMRLLCETGPSLSDRTFSPWGGIGPDFGARDLCAGVHRVSYCEAVSAARSAAGKPPLPCVTHRIYPKTLGPLTPPAGSVVACPPGSSSGYGACGVDYAPKPLATLSPWALPQPVDPKCPGCRIRESRLTGDFTQLAGLPYVHLWVETSGSYITYNMSGWAGNAGVTQDLQLWSSPSRASLEYFIYDAASNQYIYGEPVKIR